MLKKLPDFAVATKTVVCSVNPGRVLKKLSGREQGDVGEGTRIHTESGDLLIRPSKRGHNLIITAEAADSEIAAEMCGDIERRLESVFLDIEKETK